MSYLAVKEGCPRCHGKGYLPEYNHIQNGICFRCWNLSADNVTSIEHYHELVDKRKKRVEAATMDEVDAKLSTMVKEQLSYFPKNK